MQGSLTGVARACALALLLLGSCTAQQAGYLEAKTKQIQATHDTTAKGLIAANCAMSLGAYFRLNNEVQQQALAALCGGTEDDNTVTVEGLQEFLDLQEFMRSP